MCLHASVYKYICANLFACSVPVYAQAAQSAHIPPRVSITTLLRNWEEREALLHQARAEARRKREAWLLETYGGVKDGHMHEDKSQQDDARPCCSHGGHGHHQHHHGDDP